MKFMIRIFGYM